MARPTTAGYGREFQPSAIIASHDRSHHLPEEVLQLTPHTGSRPGGAAASPRPLLVLSNHGTPYGSPLRCSHKVPAGRFGSGESRLGACSDRVPSPFRAAVPGEHDSTQGGGREVNFPHLQPRLVVAGLYIEPPPARDGNGSRAL